MSTSKSSYQTHVLKYSVLHNLWKGEKKGSIRGARFHFQYPDSLITPCLSLRPSTTGYAKSLKNKKHGKCRDTTGKLFARQTARTVRVKMCRLQMSFAPPAVVFASVPFLFIFAQRICRKQSATFTISSPLILDTKTLIYIILSDWRTSTVQGYQTELLNFV